MTRINLVSVHELADQHLIAEYHELPRCIKQDIDTSDAPEKYCLGKGHMKWAKKHSVFLIIRYWFLCKEMEHRGFKVSYPYEDLKTYYESNCKEENKYNYDPDWNDILLSRRRLLEKIAQKPSWYKWTKSICPYNLKEFEK